MGLALLPCIPLSSHDLQEHCSHFLWGSELFLTQRLCPVFSPCNRGSLSILSLRTPVFPPQGAITEGRRRTALTTSGYYNLLCKSTPGQMITKAACMKSKEMKTAIAKHRSILQEKYPLLIVAKACGAPEFSPAHFPDHFVPPLSAVIALVTS